MADAGPVLGETLLKMNSPWLNAGDVAQRLITRIVIVFVACPRARIAPFKLDFSLKVKLVRSATDDFTYIF